MSGNRKRDSRGRFAGPDAVGTELKRARGNRAEGQPQIRAKHKKALTERQIETFLSTLAETCNVALSAREAKRPVNTFYTLRSRDPGFRAAWLQALHAGYDHLEMELLHRARFGTPKDVFHLGKRTGKTRIFSDGMALRLLESHRKSVGSMRESDRSGKRDAKAIFDELAARVAEIKAEKAAKARKNGDGES